MAPGRRRSATEFEEDGETMVDGTASPVSQRRSNNKRARLEDDASSEASSPAPSSQTATVPPLSPSPTALSLA
ncbi:Structural maintenance of chromosomes protein 5 [Coniosporium tulheliwenetii]|uniref:Structural maintenance of chromosomes protein 5 n=1 Tax=Coniosporium tulheliwenetii TaxID=3383036 RepID=A0ACC2YJH9_9PEZI|nr:Structural maintenance of chromosomes protein 5 [Cladosporium sp. JES 115]